MVSLQWGDVFMRFTSAAQVSALVLLRNLHRTAVAVFRDGGKFRSDPSKVDAFTEVVGGSA